MLMTLNLVYREGEFMARRTRRGGRAVDEALLPQTAPPKDKLPVLVMDVLKPKESVWQTKHY